MFFPFLAFARRLVGEARAPLAALALAVSPLHLQASTTASSEALYLLLWVAALERLLAALASRGKLGTFAVAGLLASLAAVTRYDAWLALPMVAVAAWWFARGRPAPRDGDPRPGGLRAGGVDLSDRLARLGRARPVAIRSSSRTTSRATTRGLAATAAARYGAVARAGAPARRLVAGLSSPR